jgi:hypothetical protein
MKLFLVECLMGCKNGTAFVIAEDPTEAYIKFRKFLDENDIGFEKDRELKQITLLAEQGRYPDITRLLV